MKITVRLGRLNVTVETPHHDPHAPIVPEYSGQERDVEYFLDDLEGSYGYYGHILDIENTTNLDLYAAIAKLEHWEILEIDIIPQAKPLPDGKIG